MCVRRRSSSSWPRRRLARQQIPHNGKANFAPFFTPDDRSSSRRNIADPKSRTFEIYMINVDGSGLERITFDVGFDGFPMFSPDGKADRLEPQPQRQRAARDQRLPGGLGALSPTAARSWPRAPICPATQKSPGS